MIGQQGFLISLTAALGSCFLLPSRIIKQKGLILPVLMKKLEIKTAVHVFQDAEQLPEIDRQLLAHAVAALDQSYSPYSNFQVGAALLLENGAIVLGSNQENASYPLCLCAERVALAAASSTQAGLAIKSIAITARNPKKLISQPVSPCGACRQVMCESENRQTQAMRVILRGETGAVYILDSAKDLLPLSFDASFLTGD